MRSPILTLVSLALALLAIGSAASRAQSLDPHELYEGRCAGCHAPHAGEFVPEALVRRDGGIFGRDSGKELRAFLAGGHGRLAPPEVDAMVAHLAAILEAGGLYRDKCLVCHDRAVVLARSGARSPGRAAGWPL